MTFPSFFRDVASFLIFRSLRRTRVRNAIQPVVGLALVVHVLRQDWLTSERADQIR